MKDKTIYSIGNMQIGDKIIVELITNEIAALQYEQIAFFRYAKSITSGVGSLIFYTFCYVERIFNSYQTFTVFHLPFLKKK